MILKRFIQTTKATPDWLSSGLAIIAGTTAVLFGFYSLMDLNHKDLKADVKADVKDLKADVKADVEKLDAKFETLQKMLNPISKGFWVHEYQLEEARASVQLQKVLDSIQASKVNEPK